jgi:CRP-like cAMP-binding protein
VVLPRATFEAVATTRPQVSLALARHLCALVRSTNFQMESIALYDLQTRLVRFLLSLLARQQEPAHGGRQRIVLGLTQGEVAAILGATRPKVSMAFQALATAGALQSEGDALVCDVALLARLAEGDPAA